jgi:hypothetical protein
MKDKTKRTLLIASGVVVCVALTVVIASLFNRPAAVDPAPESSQSPEAQPQVEIKTPDISTSNTGDTGTTADPGAGADSSGTEQTIQADPVKPDAPAAPSTVAESHTAEDVPEADRNAETPPTYTKEQTTVTEPSTPDAGSTNANGQVYVPGFGYVTPGDGNQGSEASDMYENGNKIGDMG